MPTLALAGGTSPSLGRAIVAAVMSSTGWNTIILSRTPKAPLWLRAIDKDEARTEIRVVDYLNTDSITSALDGVHTVVSVTSALDGTQGQIQVNLLEAAVKAGCKRFAPAQWAFGPKGWENVTVINGEGAPVWAECVKHEDKIECAKFNIGSFMNYIGLGIHPTSATPVDDESSLRQLEEGGGYMPGEDEATQGLQRQGDLKDGSGAFLIGMKNAIAELPVREDGQWPRISLITMRDVGRFIAASLDLPKWEEDMTMVGDTLTMGELLAHAEEVTGKKFQVDLIKKEDMERKLGDIAPEDFMSRAWAEFKLAYIRDLEDEVVVRPVVNNLCPAVKPLSAREYLEQYWTAARD